MTTRSNRGNTALFTLNSFPITLSQHPKYRLLIPSLHTHLITKRQQVIRPKLQQRKYISRISRFLWASFSLRVDKPTPYLPPDSRMAVSTEIEERLSHTLYYVELSM